MGSDPEEEQAEYVGEGAVCVFNVIWTITDEANVIWTITDEAIALARGNPKDCEWDTKWKNVRCVGVWWGTSTREDFGWQVEIHGVTPGAFLFGEAIKDTLSGRGYKVEVRTDW